MKRTNDAKDLAASEADVKRHQELVERRRAAALGATHDARDRKQARREAREKLLDELAPDRRCPRCGRKQLHAKMWCVRELTPGTRSATCRTCERLRARLAALPPPRADAPTPADVLVLRVTHVVRGRKLAALREARGLLAFQLAKILEISRVKLCRLESDFETVIGDELYERIARWSKG